MNIRPFEPADYQPIAAIMSANHDNTPITPEKLAEDDAFRKCVWQRFVALGDAGVVGYGEHLEYGVINDITGRMLKLYVKPNEQRLGYGSALYQKLIDDLPGGRPLYVVTYTDSRKVQSIRFLVNRGFSEGDRTIAFSMKLENLVLPDYSDIEDKLAAKDIRVIPYECCCDSRDFDRQLYEIDREVQADIPGVETRGDESFEHFVYVRLRDSDKPRSGVFVAVHNAKPVGYCSTRDRGKDLHVGMTGVCKEYRRQGVARLMKLRCLGYARNAGYEVVSTSNHSDNHAILAVNRELGFKAKLEMIQFTLLLENKRPEA